MEMLFYHYIITTNNFKFNYSDINNRSFINVFLFLTFFDTIKNNNFHRKLQIVHVTRTCG